MTTISFYAPGEPKGQPRQRTFAYKAGKKPDGSDRIMVRNYNPGTAEAWKSCVAAAARPFRPQEPLLGPLKLDLTFYFPRPKWHFRTGKHAGQLRDDAPVYHTSKPDRDNLEKAVMDAMKMLGFFRDDSQVCDGRVPKLYCTGGNLPGCQVTLETLWPTLIPAGQSETADGSGPALELFTKEAICPAP